MEEQQVEYVIKKHGLYRVLPHEFIGTCDDLLARYAKDAARRLPNAVAVGGEPAHFSVRDAFTVAWLRLKQLSIRAAFEVREDCISPLFDAISSEPRIIMTWVPPADMALFLAVDARWNGTMWHGNKTYLFARKDGTPGNFSLPLPNTYSDAALCLGNVRLVKSTLADLLSQAVELVNSSTWNSDLNNNAYQASIRRLFRFDPATLRSLPDLPSNWETACQLVNVPAMTEVVLP